MRLLKYCLCLMLFCYSILSEAQTPPSNLEGLELRQWLKANYYDGKFSALTYREAREKMYAFIDNKDGKITCVYSGYEKSNPYGNETTGVSPINTEHTVPQSFFGSAEPMRSDIFHLFPTYSNWNTERSNYPFEEISDNRTDKWIYLTNSQNNIPSSNIERYSEKENGGMFEPREDHKGDVARAVFYFYTMYPNAAGSIHDVGDLTTFCNWNAQDPVSQKEIDRNNAIEEYQGNRNPYITLNDLPHKTWGCPTTSTKNVKPFSGRLSLFPNPTNDILYVQIEDIILKQDARIILQDIEGKILKTQEVRQKYLELDIEGLAQGVYILKFEHQGEVAYRKVVKL